MLPLRFRRLRGAAKTLTYLNSITKYFIPQKAMQHKQNRASLRKKMIVLKENSNVINYVTQIISVECANLPVRYDVKYL